MTPDISEFSYGFALTHELIGLAGGPLRAAPIFPSLIEEGKPGGGYDVNLDIPGFPLFLQFKRSDCMVRTTAKEVSSPYNFSPPFYRMKITERSRSAQHDLLLDLDDGHNQVFYAAPLFHTVKELNAAFLTTTVASRSFYIRPSRIGKLDNESHHVAFDAKRSWVFSEPRKVEGVRGAALYDLLRERRLSDSRALRDGPITESLKRVETLLNDRDLSTDLPDSERAGKGDEATALRRLADFALRYFNAQLFIVQDAPPAADLGGDDVGEPLP